MQPLRSSWEKEEIPKKQVTASAQLRILKTPPSLEEQGPLVWRYKSPLTPTSQQSHLNCFRGISTHFFHHYQRVAPFPLTLFICVAFLSIVCSPFSRYYLQYTTLFNLTLAFLASHLTPSVLSAFLGVTALECLIGIGQFLAQYHLGLQCLSEPVITPYMDNIATFSLSSGEFCKGLLPWPD